MSNHQNSTTANQQTHQPQREKLVVNNDDLSIKELVAALFKNKAIIIACTIALMLVSIAYVMLAQEWWSATAKVVKPQIQDYSELSYQVRKFQPAFEIQEEEKIIQNNDMLDLIGNEAMFEQFILAFNSTSNKKRFLLNSPQFNQYLSANNISEQDTDKALSNWYSKLTAKPANKRDKNPSVFIITMQSHTRNSSYEMLNDYVNFVSNIVHDELLSGIKATIDAKQSELENKLFIIESKAKNTLEIERKKTKLALRIAKEAGIQEPLQNLNNNEFFSVSLGLKALNAKSNVLNDFDELSILEPELGDLNAKLALLNRNNLQNDISFDVYRYLENIEIPYYRDSPKRSLIILFGTLAGFIFGVGIVLFRQVLK
ncbi:Wzz/FepE/Etk N-terminal domain-containing protein [Photobacterium sp. SDRW27]|uniref:Wzz/FepE/Etk N-terminal domain-containing protein n=1 Tax=Photobacterium obscurum TaxID=2829490 RepID=UPI002244A922|nr:Wzz/FepE/Etk N-terminal domain-containing protein [Photobacterium obscurum]MCW8328255.1 Wzz/FepE/Etk N-terminal domain-containing protein [Photobacterium obscurum]